MRNNIKTAGAFLIGLSVASSVTYAQLGGRGRNVAFVDGTTISPTSVTASGTGDQFVCTSATAVCEVESSINATTMTATVPAFDIGPTATPGTDDRLACFSYGATGSKTRVACVDKEGDVNANSMTLGLASNGVRLHALTEQTNFAPLAFDEKQAVFGKSPTSGASSGAVYLSYNTSANQGVIGALSPGSAWRPLSLNASEIRFRIIDTTDTVVANNVAFLSTVPFASTVASGSNAFTCANVGCRLTLGSTARYLVDDGTNLEFVAPVQATSFEALATSGSSFTGGNSSTSLTMTSNTPDSVTSSTVPAIRLQASQNIADGDALFTVEDSGGNIRLRMDENGTLRPSTVVVGNSQLYASFSYSDDYSVATTSTNTVTGRALDGASSVGIILRTVTNQTTEGAKIVSFRKNTTVEQASIDKDGLLRVNAANAAKPSCNATNRGKVFFLDGAAGVADTYEICGKDAADVYAWKAIVTF